MVPTFFKAMVCVAAGLLLFISCGQDIGTNPYDCSNTKAIFALKPSLKAAVTVTYTAGDSVKLGFNTNLALNVDSVLVWQASASGALVGPIIRLKNVQSLKFDDTVWNSLLLTDSGSVRFIDTVYLNCDKKLASTFAINVLPGKPNHPPVIFIPRQVSLRPGEACTLTVSGNDPDSFQTLTFSLVKAPPAGTFNSQTHTFMWTAPNDFAGKDSVVFSVKDNGYPQLSTQQTVYLLLPKTIVNQPPQWQSATIVLAASVGSTRRLTLSDKCSDPEGGKLTFVLMDGKPDGDTIISDVYSFTPAKSDTGIFYPRIIAKDTAGLTDTVTIQFKITTDDRIGPDFGFVVPAKDSATVGANSVALKVACADPSGVAWVKCSMGSDTFAVSGADSIYSATVTGLKSSAINEILFFASDKSPNNNTDTFKVYIKYSLTVNDSAGPVIKLNIPNKDTVSTNSNSYTIAVQCTDASGVLSVNGLWGSSPFPGVHEAGDNWTITVTGLAAALNTIIVTAIDSSARANKTLDTFYIKFDPTMQDTIGPTITQLSGPHSGDIISNPSVTIVDTIYDPSNVDSVYWKFNNGAITMLSPVTGSAGRYVLTATISRENLDTITVVAVDKATRRNHSTQMIVLNYIIAPALSNQPIKQTVCEGSPAGFSVTATGTAPLSYQWRIGAANPTNISGANSATYSPSTAVAGQTILSCVVSNGSAVTAVSNLCTLTVNAKAATPTAAATLKAICSPQTSTLSVSAGDPGTGGSWKWYTNNVSPGSSNQVNNLTVSPTSTTTYYVRSEGAACGNSDWGSVQITVNTKATTPTAAATLTAICSPQTSTLSVSAGVPGTGGSWKWYTNNVNPSSSNQVNNLTVSPTSTTTYFVRSEGGACGNSDWGSVQVTVNAQSVKPTSINASPSASVCPNSGSVTLSVNGGSLGTNATWQWYSDQNCTNKAGSGPSIFVSTGQAYYVRAEGICGNTPTVNIVLSLAPLTLTPNPPYGQTCLTSNAQVAVTPSCTAQSIAWYFNPFGIPGDDRLITSTTSEYTIIGNALRCNMVAGSDVHCVVTDQAGRTVTSGTWNWGQAYCH